MLIWGKTYPEWSKSHYETVCTGAVDEETGRLIRIYPITLRYADASRAFKKYQWIRADVERNTSDHRPESYRINQATIEVEDTIGTKGSGWEERRQWVLRDHSVFTSVEALKEQEREDRTSLGLVRPRAIRRFYEKRKTEEARAEWEVARTRALAQKDLFVDVDAETKELKFMPVQYRVEFECEDDRCNGHDMSILDWELYALSRKMYAARGAGGARKAVLDKLAQITNFDKFEPYFYLGNVAAHPTSFMVVGLFTPPRKSQMGLFTGG